MTIYPSNRRENRLLQIQIKSYRSLFRTLQRLHTTLRIKSNQFAVCYKAPGSPRMSPPSVLPPVHYAPDAQTFLLLLTYAKHIPKLMLNVPWTSNALSPKILPWPCPPSLVKTLFHCNLIRKASLYSSKFTLTHHLLLLWPTLFSSKHLPLWNHTIDLFVCINDYHASSPLRHKPLRGQEMFLLAHDWILNTQNTA